MNGFGNTGSYKRTLRKSNSSRTSSMPEYELLPVAKPREIPTRDIFPSFHLPDSLKFALQKVVILQALLNFAVTQFISNFTVCPSPQVISLLQKQTLRLVEKNDLGRLARAISDLKTYRDRIEKAVIQDILRPVFWKLNHPDGGFLEYDRTYRGVSHSRGSKLIADLILEPWPILELGFFGLLSVNVRPNRTMYGIVKEAYKDEVTRLESLNPPYSDGVLEAALSVIVNNIDDVDFTTYQFRQTAGKLPAIGDLFFYEYLLTDYVYVLTNEKVNLLSMSMNFFLNTHFTNEDLSPIGHTFTERMVTIKSDGSKVEEVSVRNLNEDATSTVIDGKLLEKMYEWEDNFNLTTLQVPLMYIYLGNTTLQPTINLGFKGEPGTQEMPFGGGPQPNPPSGLGFSGGQTGAPGSGTQLPPLSSPPSSGGTRFNVFGVDIQGLQQNVRNFVDSSSTIMNEASNLMGEARSSGNSEQQRQAVSIANAVSDQQNVLERVLDFVSVASPDPRVKAVAVGLRGGVEAVKFVSKARKDYSTKFAKPRGKQRFAPA